MLTYEYLNELMNKVYSGKITKKEYINTLLKLLTEQKTWT